MFVKVNTLAAVKDYFKESLSSIYSPGEIEVLFEITSEYFLKINKLTLKASLNQRLSESELLDFHFTLKRLKVQEPIQHILEEAPFLGLRLKVNQHTLIPRPETEELVDYAIRHLGKNAKIIDIGTGSGCIALGLKHLRNDLNVNAVDISNEALQIAKENASRLALDIHFETFDALLSPRLSELLSEDLDAIISNPPYICYSEKKEMSEQVTKYEPNLALFVDDQDPLIFYKKIGDLGLQHLKTGGQLFFEINQNLGSQTSDLLESMGYSEVILMKDINHNNRMIHAKK